MRKESRTNDIWCHWRLYRTVCFVLACTLGALPGVFGQDAGLMPLRINCGLSASDFSRLNENEAKAAFTIYAEVVGRQIGYDVDFITTIYRDRQDLERALEQQNVDLLSLEVIWYAEKSVGCHVTPTLVPEESPGVVLDTYVLLARREDGPAVLGDLEGSKLLYIEHEDANMAKVWLDVTMMELGFPPSERFAGSMERVNKSSSTVLPVFFGKADACVVDRSSFTTLCDLNPQVGRTLAVIAESEPVLDTVICFNPSGALSESEERDLKNALLRLQETPQGEQILTLFGITGFVPIMEGHIDSALDLLRRHERLRSDLDPAIRQQGE